MRISLGGNTEIYMDVVLQTNTDNPSFALKQIHWFSDGSGYKSDYVVRSSGFSATYPFYFEVDPLQKFLEAVEAMDRELQGSAVLKPMFEPDFVRLTLDSSGHVEVSGEITQHSPGRHCLIFSFLTDQTCLRPLIAALRDVVKLQQKGSARVAP